MNKKAELTDNLDEGTPLTYYRLILGLSGAVYLSWWFVVEALLPDSFNPFLSRLVAAAFLWLVLAGTFLSEHIRKHVDFSFVFFAEQLELGIDLHPMLGRTVTIER